MTGRSPNLEVAAWLLVSAAFVAAMVVVGGVTRLTGSGLSMVEWQPVWGILPPLGDADWQRLFAAYQATPQFAQVNAGMTVAEFRGIFWWEYLHRLIGRLIGFVFLLPLLWFLARRRIGFRQALGYLGIFALGGAQGLLGWYMVKSGLVDRPWVSPPRLAAHLGLAVLIYALLLWSAWRLLWPTSDALPDDRLAGVRRLAWCAVALVAVTLLSGALMAGSHAGFVFNTWPLIEGRLLPPSYMSFAPWPLAPIEHQATINFNHRTLAILTLLLVLALWWRSRWLALAPRARRVANAAALLAAAQVALGVATLLLVVPVPLAVLHQATGLGLFTLVLWLAYELRPPR